MDELKTIRDTIEILESYNNLYKRLSGNRYDNYADYITKGDFADEDELMKSIFRDFLEKVLGFPRDRYIPEERDLVGQPDFKPLDRRTHNFILEVKGTDSRNLTEHFEQVSGYVQRPAKWGIITNMRDLLVFEPPLPTPVIDYSFSFARLYNDYKKARERVLGFSNTERFINFIKRFSYREINIAEKIEKIKSAPQWTGEEVLNIKELTNTIRGITKRIKEDVEENENELRRLLKYGIYDEEVINIAKELEEIGFEIERERERPEIVDTRTFSSFLNAEPGSTENKAFRIYISRIAYFTMTRVLLARMWEDIGFIEQSLYDGGFAEWYEKFNEKIQDVLEYAFNLAGKQYSWLYHIPNNYTWYKPSDDTVVEVLYELSNYNLGKLDTDVLGYVYEEFIDNVDRKNKGQYYTPREIITFIWDRVGYIHEEDFFRYENGKRKPKYIFDPATGSGGFLVEAVKRIRERTAYGKADFREIVNIFLSMVESVYGSEISVFAYYIAEVNLLVQVTKIINELINIEKHVYKSPPFVLNIVPLDSLGFVRRYNTYDKEDDEVRGLGTNILDKNKSNIYLKIQDKSDFDYVCANPPYIGEKGHKELFRHTISKYPFWREHYQGKMDYLYWFIILALLKLREGGKLGFITTNYWLNADGASQLRAFILKNALIKEIINFGKVSIFDNAPGQHDMVFILEKCSNIEPEGKTVRNEVPENIEKKRENRIKLVNVKKEPFNAEGNDRLKSLVDFIRNHIGEDEYTDEYIDVFWSGTKQGELDDGPWATKLIKASIIDVFDELDYCKPLKYFLEVRQGIVPGVDRVTKENIEYLTDKHIRDKNIRLGDGIFVLTENEVNDLKLTEDEKRFFILTYSNSKITRYIVDTDFKNKFYILYIDKEIELEKYPNIDKHLNKFYNILKERLRRYKNRGYEEKYPWYRLNRPREEKMLQSDKIVVSNWGTTWQPFAFQTGDYYEKRDITIFVKSGRVEEALLYFLALLNSSLLKTWMVVKAKQLGYMRQSVQEKMPIRSIDFSYAGDVEKHDRLVNLVEDIIKLKTDLAGYNRFYLGRRLTSLLVGEEVPPINLEEITTSLPQKAIRTLRTHPKIQFEYEEEFHLSSVGDISPLTEENNALFDERADDVASLELRGKGRKKVRITSRRDLLEYLAEVLTRYQGETMTRIVNVRVPKEVKALNEKRAQITKEVKYLLDRIFAEETEIDQIVYELYGLTREQIDLIESELTAS